MPKVQPLLGLAVAGLMCIMMCSDDAVAETPCADDLVQAERKIATNGNLPVKDKVKAYTNIKKAYLACLGKTRKVTKMDCDAMFLNIEQEIFVSQKIAALEKINLYSRVVRVYNQCQKGQIKSEQDFMRRAFERTGN